MAEKYISLALLIAFCLTSLSLSSSLPSNTFFPPRIRSQKSILSPSPFLFPFPLSSPFSLPYFSLRPFALPPCSPLLPRFLHPPFNSSLSLCLSTFFDLPSFIPFHPHSLFCKFLLLPFLLFSCFSFFPFPHFSLPRAYLSLIPCILSSPLSPSFHSLNLRFRSTINQR